MNMAVENFPVDQLGRVTATPRGVAVVNQQRELQIIFRILFIIKELSHILLKRIHFVVN